MTLLSVNVNKLATLRNSRGGNRPNVVDLAEKILGYGAHGLTVHPRPDGRHIRRQDVLDLSALVKRWNRAHLSPHPAEFNIEGFPAAEFIAMVNQVRPNQVTLVPDPPEALTSNAGWDLVARESELAAALVALKPSAARVSLFVDPAQYNPAQDAALERLRPARIELYTESYAKAFATPQQEQVTAVYQAVARSVRALGVGVNAGHDLDQFNLGPLISAVPTIEEVSIGHALICEALEQGLERTVKTYVQRLAEVGP